MLKAADPVVALDDWEPFPDGTDAAQAVRDALEDGLARGDRVMVFWISETAGSVRIGQCNIQRRSRKVHWLTMFGALHEWLQRLAHNDFDHV